jgi:hypothetical protein
MSDRKDEILGWFLGRIPDDWFASAPTLEVDRDEVLIVGDLAEPAMSDDVSDEARLEAVRSRIQAFRERTRAARVEIASAAETRFERKVSWGARCGNQEAVFTHLAAPAMTRLRMSERRVLDTLVDAGVAKSRSEALAWCVRLVAAHESEWLGELRTAMTQVEDVRRRGPA